MSLIQTSFVFLAALSSGTLNSVAGGGGLIMFPTLLITGMSPVVANATSTIAALPGLIAGAKAYHPDLQEVKRYASCSVALASWVAWLVRYSCFGFLVKFLNNWFPTCYC